MQLLDSVSAGVVWEWVFIITTKGEKAGVETEAVRAG